MLYAIDEGGEKKMAGSTKKKVKVVNALLDREPEYVRIADWDGKSLSFILADEICSEEKPGFSEEQVIEK
jgi:hypothetical protein